MAAARDEAENWAALKVHLSKNSGLVAHTIVTNFNLLGDGAPMSGRYVTVIGRSSSSGEPVRELQSETEDGHFGRKMEPLAFGIAVSFANRPDHIFATVENLRWLGEEKIDGQKWDILEVQSYMRAGKAPIRAKAWLSNVSGRVWKIHGSIEKSILPGVKTVNFTVKYELDSTGRSLPTVVTVSYPISMLFHAGSVSFTHELSDWKSH